VATPRIVDTSDPEQTEALGAELAAVLKPGDLVLVRGDLGVGKTTFVRGAARALGVSDPVTSPTFSIGHRYGGGDVDVSHLDLYRLQDLAHEEPDLLADYLGEGRIAFVEWPLQSSAELAGARAVVTLSHLGRNRRRIELLDRGTPEKCAEANELLPEETSGRPETAGVNPVETSGRPEGAGVNPVETGVCPEVAPG
jgi:tRNA threonylcarbamoyladenosine biosynthesis protein TsaE